MSDTTKISLTKLDGRFFYQPKNHLKAELFFMGENGTAYVILSPVEKDQYKVHVLSIQPKAEGSPDVKSFSDTIKDSKLAGQKYVEIAARLSKLSEELDPHEWQDAEAEARVSENATVASC